MKLLHPSCGHVWTTKVDKPISCPFCKQYFKGDNQPVEVTEDED